MNVICLATDLSNAVTNVDTSADVVWSDIDIRSTPCLIRSGALIAYITCEAFVESVEHADPIEMMIFFLPKSFLILTLQMGGPSVFFTNESSNVFGNTLSFALCNPGPSTRNSFLAGSVLAK